MTGDCAEGSVRLLKNGREAFPAMLEAIDRARSRVFLEMYFFAPDATGLAFRDRLASAARRGVRVMVLADAWGSWATPDSFWDPLRSAGAEVRLFRPMRRGLFPFRDHRKLLLTDDHPGFVGGLNIADEYGPGAGGEPPWRDNVMAVEGPAAARLARPFLRMWIRAGRPLRRMGIARRRPGARGLRGGPPGGRPHQLGIMAPPAVAPESEGASEPLASGQGRRAGITPGDHAPPLVTGCGLKMLTGQRWS